MSLKIDKSHESGRNRSSRGGAKIKYIAIHYVGGYGTAINNCDYIRRPGGSPVSAHFFVDDKGVFMSIDPYYAAWAVGGKLQDGGYKYGGAKLYGDVSNSNSVSIELCCHNVNGRLVPTPSAIKNAKPLVKYLMKNYKVPMKNVIRHFDVTGKQCPLGYTNDKSWKLLHEFLTTNSDKCFYYIADKELTLFDDASTKSPRVGHIPNGMIFKVERKWNRKKGDQHWRRYAPNKWVCIKGKKRYASFLGY